MFHVTKSLLVTWDTSPPYRLDRRKNEADALFLMVHGGIVCRFPVGGRLAGSRCHARTDAAGVPRIVGDVASASPPPRGHSFGCHGAVSHLFVAPPAPAAYAGFKERTYADTVVWRCQAIHCQTTPFLFRQQMPFGVGTVLSVSLLRLLCHRSEAHHSLA